MDKKSQIESQINLQKVIQNELMQLTNTSKVYHKQPGGDIFFLSSVEQEKQASKRTLENLMKEYKTVEQMDKELHHEKSSAR